jgi:hypothetical protein
MFREVFVSNDGDSCEVKLYRQRVETKSGNLEYELPVVPQLNYLSYRLKFVEPVGA